MCAWAASQADLMGHGSSRGYICCSVREKYGHGDGLLPLGLSPQFQSLEAEVPLEQPVFATFAPLHQKEVPLTRRIALASRKEVHVYRVREQDSPNEAPTFTLSHVLHLESNQVVTAIAFTDEDSSRQLAVAFGPEAESHKGHCVKIWSCEETASLYSAASGSNLQSNPSNPSMSFGPGSFLTATKSEASEVSHVASEQPTPVVQWSLEEGYVASLEEHSARVTRLAMNRTCLLTADDGGECRVWMKNRGFARRTAAVMHRGGVADLAADRLFAYTAGMQDLRVCVWSIPDLSLALAVPVDIPAELFWPLPECIAPQPQPARQAPPRSAARRSRSQSPSPSGSMSPRRFSERISPIAQLGLIRRPLSRWAGWQGSNRGPKAPRGVIFVAGVLADGHGIAGPGAGVLMEWTLCSPPTCKSAQIAHDSPIIALVHGPYDNGPLVTADAKGIFRVWECLLDKGLRFSQQITVMCLASPGELAMAVEQPRGLYVAAGGRRLFVWQRYQDGQSLPAAP